MRIPSKVNLFLAVRGLRTDGYHELVSVMQTVAIHDRLTARIDGGGALHPAARPHMAVALTHDAGADVPTDDQNLAVRAAQALLQRIGGGGNGHRPGADVPVTRLHLDKRIPVAGGMAGGSADAAAALVALNQLWDCELTADELRDLAAGLGADVPFCVLGGTALATGTGTATARVLTRGTYHWIVGMSDQPLSTADVYAAWDRLSEPSQIEPDAVLAALSNGDVEALGAALHNDLEKAAFHLRPRLEDQRDAMLEAGAMGAIVSGAGPTVVGLAHDAGHARQLAELIRRRFDRVEVATSPAGGPDLMVEREQSR